MKTDIKQIELITQYLNGELSHFESQNFEERLQLDNDLQQLFNEQKRLIEGIKRAGLKEDIRIAKQQYVQTKWLKTIGIICIPIITLLVVWISFNNKSDLEPTSNQTDTKSIITEKKATESRESLKKTMVYIDTIETAESEKVETKQVVPKIKTEPKQENTLIEKVVTIKNDTISEFESIGFNTERNESLKPFFDQVKKKPQIIEVNTEEETSITLVEGTKITFPKHAFVEENSNKLVRGNIQFEVTEYYKLADMLLGNLSTTSNDKPLETGGMLYINATKKGKKLKLKRNINIEFPYANPKPNMQLFSGNQNDDAINWIPQVNRTLEVISFGKNEENVEVPFDIVENVPVFPGCQGENQELKDCFNAKMKDFFVQNFNLEIAENLKLTGINRINSFFKIDENGNITNIRIRASSVTLGEEMMRVIKLLPKFQPALQRGQPVTVPYFMPFDIDFPGKDKRLPMVTVGSNEAFEDDLNTPRDSVKVDPKNFNAYHASAYAFSNANLGWINCDRFVSGWKSKIKYKFKVKNSKGLNVKMVFKSMSSILPSKATNNGVDFGFVPKDEEVVLVAIKKVNDIFYLGVQETQITDISELEFDFKPVTLEELKSEMKKLNDLF